MLTDVSLFLRNVLLPVSHLVLLGWVLLLLNPPLNPALGCLVFFYTVVLLVERSKWELDIGQKVGVAT